MPFLCHNCFHNLLFQVVSWTWQEDVPLSTWTQRAQLCSPNIWSVLIFAVNLPDGQKGAYVHVLNFLTLWGRHGACLPSVHILHIIYPYCSMWKPGFSPPSPPCKHYQCCNEAFLCWQPSGKRERDSKHFKIQLLTHLLFLTRSKKGDSPARNSLWALCLLNERKKRLWATAHCYSTLMTLVSGYGSGTLFSAILSHLF